MGRAQHSVSAENKLKARTAAEVLVLNRVLSTVSVGLDLNLCSCVKRRVNRTLNQLGRELCSMIGNRGKVGYHRGCDAMARSCNMQVVMQPECSTSERQAAGRSEFRSMVD